MTTQSNNASNSLQNELNTLTSIKDTLNNEFNLYKNLHELFKEKKEILIKGNVNNLLEIDDKILKIADEIKAYINARNKICFKLYGKKLTLSDLISKTKDLDNEIAEEFADLKLKICEFLPIIQKEELVVQELLKHGFEVVTKTIQVITDAIIPTAEYDSSGKSKSNNKNIEIISSVDEEV